MDIRGSEKNLKRLRKIKTSIQDINFNIDSNVEVPVVMVLTSEGKLSEFLRGYKEVATFIKYGYNRIRRSCPYRHRKCIGEKCSLYYIKNGTGDCAHIWNLFK